MTLPGQKYLCIKQASITARTGQTSGSPAPCRN